MEALFTNTSLSPTSSSHHHHHLTKLSPSSLSFLTPSKPQPLSTTRHLLITIPTASSMSSNETVEAEGDQELRQLDASFGEVHKIIGSRVGEEGKNKMEYLIEWKDGDTPSWVPGENIAPDVVAEYETPWWKAAKSADASSLQSLFDDPNSLRSIDAVDLNGRTALIFAAGLGDDECVRILASGGADLNWPDESGLTALHMAAGYVRPETVKTLLELGADPEVIDGKGRTPVQLAREVMGMTPPGQLVRRMGLQAVVKVLEAAEYEFAEVEKIIERRRGGGGRSEYLVEWRDGGGREWVDERFVAEDLAKDYDAGLEYAVAEVVAAKREVEGGGWEYLVKWADIEEPTWELAENIDVELVAEFERRAEQSHEPAGGVKSGDRST